MTTIAETTGAEGKALSDFRERRRQHHRIGGAEVSPLHANFIVNTGGATAADVDALIKLVRQRVWESTGIDLHPEVKRLGFPPDGD